MNEMHCLSFRVQSISDTKLLLFQVQGCSLDKASLMIDESQYTRNTEYNDWRRCQSLASQRCPKFKWNELLICQVFLLLFSIICLLNEIWFKLNMDIPCVTAYIRSDDRQSSQNWLIVGTFFSFLLPDNPHKLSIDFQLIFMVDQVQFFRLNT